MSNTEPSETTPATEPRSRKAKETGSPQLNKYAAARLAKKKQRRKAHRLTIKRSNTSG